MRQAQRVGGALLQGFAYGALVVTQWLVRFPRRAARGVAGLPGAVLRGARRAIAALGALPFAVVCAAALATGVMYCSNDLTDDQPAAPRGDGRYRPVMARGDGHMHFLVTRSLVFDQDVDFDNDLKLFGDPWAQPRTVTGRKNVMQQVGPSIVWAPVLAGAHGAAVVANAFGADIQMHGYTMFHQRILFATSVLFGWLAIALGIASARRLAGGRWAPAWAAVAALLGTSLTYYATYMPSYAHAMDAAACAAFLGYWLLTLGDTRVRRYVWLGVLLGIATMVRLQDVALGVVLALEIALAAIAQIRRGAPRAALGLVARGALCLAIALVLFSPQLYVWKQFYGSYVTTPQGPGQMRYGHAMVLELLFSSRNGWLSTHPIAYLGTIGLAVGAIGGPRLGPHVRLVSIALLLAIATQVYTNAITYEWWSGASFGQRRMCSVTLPILVGLALLLRAVHLAVRARIPSVAQQVIAVGVLGYLVAWNMSWVGKLRHGKPAGRNNVPSCCGDVPAPLSWVARPVYDAVGNPFALPASAWFAVRNGVELQRWDRVVGNYPLVPGVLGYEDGSYRRATASWNLAGPGGAPYLLGGYGPPQRAGGIELRWTTSERAEALLPILMPEPHRVTMPIAANVAPGETLDVTVSCNGREVARARVGDRWTNLTFDTTGDLGENRIVVESAVAPYHPRTSLPMIPPPPDGASAGVAIGVWRIGLPP
ncbi:MAG: hypothetical protein KIT31_41790 [Deltaproteobacteria bacterium]|nr:hypothetical protein [Deltaproteobacteria bacterium]